MVISDDDLFPIILLIPLLLLGACQKNWHIHDPDAELSAHDFRALSFPPVAQSGASGSKAMGEWMPPAEEEDTLAPWAPPDITFNLSGDFSITGLVKQIAQKAQVSLVLDPSLEGTVHYEAKARSLSQIIDDLSNHHNLRIEFVKGSLVVKKDRPYVHVYDVKFMNINRSTSRSMTLNTSIHGLGSAENGVKGTGSTSQLSEDATMDVWVEVQANLEALLGSAASDKRKKEREGGEINTRDVSMGRPQPGGVWTSSREETQKDVPYYTFNKMAGLLLVNCPHRLHKIIEQYLASIKRAIGRQVLIEAKVIEIKLKDEYRNGINWESAFQGALNFETHFADSARQSFFSGVISPQNLVSVSFAGGGLTGLLGLLSAFGTVRTLSSPRLTVMHNQSAVIKVADNLVFFRVKYDRQYYNTERRAALQNTTVQSFIETVPVGFIMVVQPTIDEKENRITLTLRPTLSSVMGLRQDPAVQLMAKEDNKKVQSEIPIIAVREMDSVLHVRSGEVVVLGGLMQQSAENVTAGVPGLEETPLNFFTHSTRRDSFVRELVILLRATILESASLQEADRRLVTKYVQDPRPF